MALNRTICKMTRLGFCALAVVALSLGFAMSEEDPSSLLQWAAKRQQQDQGRMQTAVVKLAKMARMATKVRELVLRKPLDCALLRNPLWMLKHTPFATEQGHADPHAWCEIHPEYLPAASECVKGNLTGFARLMHATKSAQKGSERLLKNDAQYCRLAGHCNNTEVQDGTTMLEAEAMCNRTLGFENWGSIDGWHYGIAESLVALSTRLPGGRLDAKLASGMAEVSCATGSYHCDVVYCRENFCKDGK